MRSLPDNATEPDGTVELRGRNSYGDRPSTVPDPLLALVKGKHDYQAIRLDRHGAGR